MFGFCFKLLDDETTVQDCRAVVGSGARGLQSLAQSLVLNKKSINLYQVRWWLCEYPLYMSFKYSVCLKILIKFWDKIIIII